MNERLKELRTILGLTMEKFGEQVGVKKSAINKLEKGENNLTEQMIKSICLTRWNGKTVNENWLRTGEGSMFVEFTEKEEVADLVYSLLGPNKDNFHELIIEIMRTYKQLDSDSKAAVNSYIQKLCSNLAEKKGD